MKEVLPLPKARVPVVKFVVPDTGTKVDVTVNNILACINTKLLADYAAVDPRLAQLVSGGGSCNQGGGTGLRPLDGTLKWEIRADEVKVLCS